MWNHQCYVHDTWWLNQTLERAVLSCVRHLRPDCFHYLFSESKDGQRDEEWEIVIQHNLGRVKNALRLSRTPRHEPNTSN